MDKQNEFEKLKDDVHYLIVTHCKYKDMSMYDRALKQFQEDINYGQLEEMSYDERFAFLIGFETALKKVEAVDLKDCNKTMMKPIVMNVIGIGKLKKIIKEDNDGR